VTRSQTVIEQTAGVGTRPVESLLIEQRRYRRFSTTLDVEIFWQDEYGLPCVSPAVVRNVSAGGFGIELGRKPPVGSLVTVRTLKSSMQCVVRHAQPDQGAYLVGVEMLPAPDGTTPTQSLERLAAALSAARKASLEFSSDAARSST
jgi:PilZ domain